MESRLTDQEAGRRCAEIAYARRSEVDEPGQKIVINNVVIGRGQAAQEIHATLNARLGRRPTDEEVRASTFVRAAVSRFNELCGLGAFESAKTLAADLDARDAAARAAGAAILRECLAAAIFADDASARVEAVKGKKS
jgi:hypothetical protein